MDTLEEIANAINNDKDVYDTLTNAVTSKQDKHAALTSISGLTTSADKMIYTTASNTYTTTPLTSFARTLLDDADASTAQATLNVPTRTGGNASGTWGISISGIAAKATNDSEGKKISEHTVEYIIGTQTTTTGAWTGVTKDSALYAGKMIIYKLPYAGSGNATLNLTLSGGGTTGAIAIYRYASTRLSTQYAANYYIPLVYNGQYWFVFADYDTTVYDRIRSANAIATADGAVAACKFIGSSDGIKYKEINSGTTFDIRYPVLYNITATADAAEMSTGIYWISQSQNMQTILNDTTRTFTNKSQVFIKGTLSNNIFTVHSDILTTTVPTTNDGYYYLYVGRTYSTYQMNVNVLYNQLWCYINSSFQPLNSVAIKAIQDIQGQQINSTYIKGLSANGKTITYTKGDNTTGTLTTQDTTYSAATSSALGLVKIGSNITNSNGTISLTKTNVTTALGYTPPTSDTNTHYTTKLIVGASDGTANATTTNGNTYLRLFDDTTARNSINIKGSGATTVTSDANGVITINSTDNNTTYSTATTSANGLMSSTDKSKLDGIQASATAVSFTSSLTSGTKVGTITINGTATDLYCQTNTNTDTKVTNTLGTTTKAYITGTTAATTNTGTQIFDTGVYLSATAGELVATKFTGTLNGNANTATKATQDASGNVITDTYSTKVNTIKDLSINGKTITYTKGDDTTGTLTTQDTAYSAATSSALGLVKIGSNITNSNGTISLTKDNVTTALGYTPPTSDTNTHYTTKLIAG